MIIYITLHKYFLAQEIFPCKWKSQYSSGSELVFNCTRNGSILEDIFPQLNNEDITDTNRISATWIVNGASYTFGPVKMDHNGSKLRCRFDLLRGSVFTVDMEEV